MLSIIVCTSYKRIQISKSPLTETTYTPTRESFNNLVVGLTQFNNNNIVCLHTKKFILFRISIPNKLLFIIFLPLLLHIFEINFKRIGYVIKMLFDGLLFTKLDRFLIDFGPKSQLL